jgi:hypothetical protein
MMAKKVARFPAITARFGPTETSTGGSTNCVQCATSSAGSSTLAKANDDRRPARASNANDGSTRTRMTRAQSQEIDRRVLALLAEDSAQRPAALAMLTETSVGSMNARLNRLVRDGELKKSKRGNTIRYQVPPGDDHDGH